MNEQATSILATLGVIAFFAFVIYASRKAEEARKRRLEAFCAQHGFQNIQVGPAGCSGGFTWNSPAAPESHMLEVLSGFRPFGVGDSRRALHLAAKLDRQRWEYLMTYSYSTGSGKNRTTHTYDVLIWQLPHNWPKLFVRPQGFLDNVGGLLGIRDIQFESDEFNQRMHISSEDPQFAYSVLHPEAMEFSMHCVNEQWQFNGQFLVIALSTGTVFDRYPQLSYHLQQFLDLVPEFVNDERRLPTCGDALLPIVPISIS